ncbi:glycosyltransferase [Sinorhizobium americanum]|uniref:glycosyltransferase n=1 Tax=Sinorhizobium americanum TaxID=194963 RepID=UPI0007D97B59|nr:glycosyltransferase [Sinorhizobium americanum]OAP34050.1 hypothetical protein ATC00_28580 [Sinorhizobium americanum]
MRDQVKHHLEQVTASPPSEDDVEGSFSPKVAVVVPAYKHSVLLAEAVESALAQEAPFDIAVVIVDDGCPFPETGQVGRTYALAHSNVF